ncbi:MAG TPA: hypothetical protein VFE09_04005 [Rubrobacteraceae bacterium]|nr:hypothetical protein [Rubrobacteraceae bacterium]
MREKKEGPTKNGRFKGKKRASWPLLVGLALVTLLAAVSCGGAAGEQRAEEPVEDEPQTPVDRAQVETKEPQAGADLGHPSLGQKNAPVLTIEYADYQ